MSITARIYGTVASITILGRFDFKVHREFKGAYASLIGNAAVQKIEVEMIDVDYLDSSALGMLMLLHERAKADNKSVVLLLGKGGVVAHVLEVANFGKIFKLQHVRSKHEVLTEH